ncbi:MAG TPA: ATP-grasp domain-containing protein, partial [Chthoniobacteraceae bacterium]|nr:ATP-grasp domain-containing protein [Chthoniobacteraceae bacterium]
NIHFIGPPASAMRAMGDKNLARQFARRAGVPVTPGSDGVVTEENDALKVAKKVGYPVMIKAVAGGGGRGMRAAHNDASFLPAFHAARLEAEKAFGNRDVYIEKLIVNPHHIEFQIVADKHGHIVHLGERDCSIQRRNQKVIEECPSPLMTEGLRKKMGHACVKLAQAVGYQNAGTMEFLVDNSGHFYFMEMNTRIQVEHTITEEAYGIDLVKEQIKVAAGEQLSQFVRNAKLKYHAMECRVNAEDPFNNFQPSPGRIDLYYAPGGRGVRIDSHAYTGYSVPPHYDSLIAKVIAMGTSRQNALDRMRRALGEYIIRGIKTTIPFQEAIMRDPDFVRGKYDTSFVGKIIESGVAKLRG